MARFDSDMRQLERRVAKLTGNRAQAAKLRKSIEKQVAQAAPKTEAQVIAGLVRQGKAGYVNEFKKTDAVPVERNTDCRIVGANGKGIRGTRISLPITLAIDRTLFIQYLKTPGIELYVPFMYLDEGRHVTVGIGHLLDDADEAKGLTFYLRGTSTRASTQQIEAEFNRVKNSSLLGGFHPNFEPITTLDLSEADAVVQANKNIHDFLELLRGPTSFPSFDTYPVTAKMGILDIAFTTGVAGTKTSFPLFTAAVRRRDWKVAAKEQADRHISIKRKNIVAQWFKDAAQKEKFFIHQTCKNKLVIGAQ